MNNEELVELARLSRTAPKSVDAFLDVIAKRYLGLVGRQGSFQPYSTGADQEPRRRRGARV